MSSSLGRTLATLAVVALAPATALAAPGDVTRVAPGALEVSVSADGGSIAFTTNEQLDRDLDRNEGEDVYVATRDPEGGTDFRLISRGLGGQSADGSSRGPEISADGTTVAFFSQAMNLVDGDSNDREDVFVAHVATGEIRRVNVTQLGGQADVGQLPDPRPSLSADGALIAFADTSRDLAPGTPFGTDALVYVRELAGGSTAFVDIGNDVSLSGDGKTVAYQRGDQVLADSGDGPELISRATGGAEGDGSSGQPDVNDDGSLIVFASDATNLAEDGGKQDIYLRDRGKAETERVSIDDRNQAVADGFFSFPSLSADGRFVAFNAEDDPNGCAAGLPQVVVRDRERESTFRGSRALEGGIPNGVSGLGALRSGPSVAAGGTHVGFPSFASNLVDRDSDDGQSDGFTTELGTVEDPDIFTPAGRPHAAEDAGTLAFDFTICRRAGRGTVARPVFATEDGSATSGEDYTALDGSEIVVPGDEDRVSVPVSLNDDEVSEPWESLFLTGFPDSGTVIAGDRARGFITDDDLPAQGPIYLEQSGEIVALDRDAEEPRPIVSGTEPAISRDGRRLAFLRPREDGSQQLWVSDPDGKDAKAVFTAAGAGPGFGLGRPAWSPDATRLAVMGFVGDPDSPTADIFLLDLEAGSTETVLANVDETTGTLSFSPGGDRLAYDTDGSVTTLDVETHARTTVDDGETPSYGPGGELVYSDASQLWLAREGEAPVRVARERASGDPSEWTDERPTFSPDGLAIAYVRWEDEDGGRWLETLNLTPGSPPARLTSRDGVVRNPAWGPAAGEVPPPPPTVSIDDASAAEGDPLGFALTLSRAASADVTVTAATSPGTAGSADFTSRSAQVTIPAGETEATFSVATTEDALDEQGETLDVALSAPAGATIADGSATGTIVDDDASPAVSIGGASAVEGNPVGLPVTLSAASGRTVTVRLDASNGTAVAPGDYTAQSNVTVTIPAGETSVTASVPTTTDTTHEPTETFTATLSEPSNATLGTATATGTITDDDPVRLRADDPAPVTEGGTLQFPIRLDVPAESDVTVIAGTSAGTATAGDDYTHRSAQVTIPAGQTEALFAVQTAADTLDEPDETVSVALSLPTGATIADSSATGTILDDDAPPAVSIGNASAPEGDPVELPVTLGAASGRTVTVRLDTSDGTATAPGDYTARSDVTVTIPAGQTSATASVPTAEDAPRERAETFTATLSQPSNATLGTASATGTITDDSPVPSLSIADASAPEGETMTFAITLSAPTFEDVAVTASTSLGTAGPADVEGKQLQLTIPAGTTTASFTVTSAEDALDEPDETVNVNLSNPSNASIGDSAAIGTIADDDAPPTVSIAGASAQEGSPVRLPVTLSAASGREVTVRVTTSDGSAGAPSDYTAQSAALVTIPAGQTSADASVPTVSDSTTEPPETFAATLSQASNATLGTATATGTITEATPVASIGTATTAEGGTLRFPVTLSRPGAGTITLRMGTQDGTATAGGDYTAVPSPGTTLTFAPGTTQQFFEVTTLEDSSTEPDETLTARLLGGSGQVATPQTSAIGTITEATPVASIGTASVAEGGTLRFPVNLNRAGSGTITLRLGTQAGSATADSDYTSVPSPGTTLTFPAGTTQQFFEVATLEDSTTEPDETLTARLFGGSGRVATPQTSATGTITEATPVASIGTATIAEGGKLRFPVTLSRAGGATITLRLGTQDGTAKAPDDFTGVASPGTTLTFPSGTTQQFFEVTTATDGLTESDETLTARLFGGSGRVATPQTSANGTITDATGALPIARGSRLGGALLAGTVKVKLPGTNQFVDLGADATFPVGSTIDTTGGTVELVSAVAAKAKFASAAAAKVQKARFSGGVFTIRQSKRAALVTLAMSGRGCKRKLTGDGKGAFAVKGRFATGTIGSARWTTTDTCKATTVKVARGKVRVDRRTVRKGRSVTVRR